MRTLLRKILPRPVINLLLCLRHRGDFRAIARFLRDDIPGVSFADKLRLVWQLYVISVRVESPHTQQEITTMIRTILSLRTGSGVLVEAGCFKGSSTAKFSLAADAVGRTLVVFDSFEGIPSNAEPRQRNIFGKDAAFEQGAYRGSLEEVRANVAKFGRIQRCRFVPGWFDATMPAFNERVAAAYVDVDLASSTRTCLRYLYPLLEPGGVIYSQDGHLPLVIDVLNDDGFWLREVGCAKPVIHGLGSQKLVAIVKT